jgi:hypothetical protein
MPTCTSQANQTFNESNSNLLSQQARKSAADAAWQCSTRYLTIYADDCIGDANHINGTMFGLYCSIRHA